MALVGTSLIDAPAFIGGGAGLSLSSTISGLGSETGAVANSDTLLAAFAKINDRLPLSGGTLTGELIGTRFTLPDGASFGGTDTDSGWVPVGGGRTFDFIRDGAVMARFGADLSFSNRIGIGVSASSPTVFLYSTAAGILSQRNGASAQELQVFETYTDASNYERLALRTAAGDYLIAAEAAGTGTQRNLNLDGAEIHTVADLHPDGRLVLPMGEASYFDLTGTSITISGTSDGSTNMVVINPTTSFNGTDFDNGGADTGRIRYTGATTRMCHIAVTMSGAPATSNDVFVVGVAKNGTVIAASKVLGSVQNTQWASIHLMTTVDQNDYLELYIGNTTFNRDFIVKSLNFFAMAM